MRGDFDEDESEDAVECGACIGTGQAGPTDGECTICEGRGCLASYELERKRHVERWYQQDQVIRELRQALQRIASMDLRFAETAGMKQIATAALAATKDTTKVSSPPAAPAQGNDASPSPAPLRSGEPPVKESK